MYLLCANTVAGQEHIFLHPHILVEAQVPQGPSPTAQYVQ